MAVSMTTPHFSVQAIKQRLSVMESTNLTFSCSADGNPAPYKYSWTGIESSDSAILKLRTIKNNDGNITCVAVNYMNDSTSGKLTEGRKNETYFLDILYPPEAEPLGMFSAIEGDYFSKTCKALSGKTSSQSVMWTEYSSTTGEHSSLLVIPNVTRNQTGKYSCEINYAMVPTYDRNETGQIKLYMHLDVLYRPENIFVRLKIGVSTEEVYIIVNKLIVIENSSLIWHCSASGKPEPKIVYWSGRVSNDSELLQFIATRKLAGSFTCNANNTMERSPGDIVNGHSSQTFYIDILYPPELRSESVIRETEGSTITLHCLLEQGRTTNQTVQWTKHGGGIWHEDSVTIFNVTILSSGNYTCEVDFYMVPTYGEPRHGLLKKEIYLKILEQSSPITADLNISTVGPAVGGAIGVLLIVVTSVASIIYCRKRRTGKSPETPVYQNMRPTDEDSMSSLNGGCSNVYEKLQNTGSSTDQQYQKLSSLVREGNIGQVKIYENLRLTQNSGKLNVDKAQGALSNKQSSV